MDDLAKKLNITDSEGWYNITGSTLQEHGGGGLLIGKYNGSVYQLLKEVYPQYQESCRNFVLRIVRDLKLDKVEDVLKVSEEFPYYIHYLVYTKLHQSCNPQLFRQHNNSVVACTVSDRM